MSEVTKIEELYFVSIYGNVLQRFLEPPIRPLAREMKMSRKRLERLLHGQVTPTSEEVMAMIAVQPYLKTLLEKELKDLSRKTKFPHSKEMTP